MNSNLSGEENSLYDDMYSLDDGESPNSSRRRRGQPIPESLKDDSYWVRRRKNNEAAKKSRDSKRAKDLLVARRAVLLETENSNLKQELNHIRNENLILRSILDEEVFYDNQKQLVDEIISIGRKANPEKVRQFAEQFNKQFNQFYGLSKQERMET